MSSSRYRPRGRFRVDTLNIGRLRRREIESFLTDYVQTIATAESQHDSGGSHSSRAYHNVEDPSTSGRDHGDSLSSIGPSLRSSEKEAMARATLKGDAEAAHAALSKKSGSGSGRGSRTGSGSGSGSGNRNLKSDRRGSGIPRYDATPNHEPLGSAPLTAVAHVADPPSLLRRPTDIFPPDRDVLAAPSFSGVEPLSTTGTGHEMRISDPSTRKRKRVGSSLATEALSNKRRPRSNQASSTAGSTTSQDPDALENTIVQMIECLFLESLPPDSDDDSPSSPPLNPLQSEPYPLPAHSSSNTQYLRTIVSSEDYQLHGGWLYLNLVSTMAALHRLSVSISTVRHALRTKSELIEVSAEGSKIRWRGPLKKPSKKEMDAKENVMQDCANDAQETIEEEMETAAGNEQRARSISSSEPATDSIFDDQPSRLFGPHHHSSTVASTAPTSFNPSNSKNGSASKTGSEWKTAGSSSNGTHSGRGGVVQLKSTTDDRPLAPLPRSVPLINSSLRNSVEEVGSPARREAEETVEALGSGLDAPQLKRHQYTPLFAKRGESSSEADEDSVESGSEDAGNDDLGEGIRPPKRRKGYEGGVVYFANDLFCSDLAGDFEVRAKLELAETSRIVPSTALGDNSSSDPMDTDEIQSSLRSSREMSVISDVKGVEEIAEHKMELPPQPIEVDDDDDTLLEIVENIPSTPEIYSLDAYLSAPRPALRLSAMSDAIASDHFTIHIKYFHRFFPTLASAFDSLPETPTRPFPRSSIFALPALFPSEHSPKLLCSMPRPLLVESKTLHHHPAVFARPPRVLMSLSSDASDSDSDSDVSSTTRRRLREDLSSTTDDRRRKRRLKNSKMRGAQMFDGPNGGGGDYLMSLALPLNRWAPVTKRSTPSVERLSSSRAGTGSGEPSESIITLD